MNDMRSWMRAQGLEQWADLFEREHIDRAALCLLDESHLKELGLPMGARAKLLAAARTSGVEDAPSVAPVAAAPATGQVAEGERRQLTVLFCDLVGFTELTARHDPEVLQRIVRAYEDACAACVARYEGYVFQRLGDGIVAFFGYPLAHEGAAERAIHAGLAILQAFSSESVPQAGKLSVRIGIAAGLVVVASMEKGAVGETMNLAARLQAVAPVDAIVVSERVRQLAGGAFDYEHLGTQALKGIAQAVEVYRVRGMSAHASRFEAATHAGLDPMVGRELELGLLLDRWKHAQSGEGQAVLLSGEPGIGKSRLLSALRERLEQSEGAQSIRYQCSPYYINSAYYPSIQQMQRALGIDRETSDAARLEKLEEFMLTRLRRPRADLRFVAGMLSIPVDQTGAVPMTPQRFKDETVRALVDLIEGMAAERPTVLLFEDAHWADPITFEMLDLLMDRARGMPLLMVLTHRPELRNPWASHGHVVSLNLSKLTKPQSVALVTHVAKGKALPADLQEQILQKTDGIPLYLEEYTKALLESDDVIELPDRYEYRGNPASMVIPATLRDSLMARLDRHQAMREIAQLGAAIGREFDHELLHCVSGKTPEELSQALTLLTDSGLAFRRGNAPQARYIFKHALVQEVAYDTLLKSRRQVLHASIARALEERFSTTAASSPETVARHWTEAGEAVQGAQWWLKAAQRALGLAARADACVYAHQGIALARRIEIPALSAELEAALQVTLGVATSETIGIGRQEVFLAFERAHVLCAEFQLNQLHPFVLGGLTTNYVVRLKLTEGLSSALAILKVPGANESRVLSCAAHHYVGFALIWLGRFPDCQNHLRVAISCHDEADTEYYLRNTGWDVYPVILTWLAIGLACMGDIRLSLETQLEAERIAKQHGHPHSAGLSMMHTALVNNLLGNWTMALHTVQTALAYCQEQAIPHFVTVAQAHLGKALVELGDAEAGLRAIDTCIADMANVGDQMGLPLFMVFRVQALTKLGRHQEAHKCVESALRMVEQCGNEYLAASLLHSAQGELFATEAVPDITRAQSSFQRAIAIAQVQQAHLFELQACTGLARLWASNGRRREAHELLHPICAWFQDKGPCGHLQTATTLLRELGASPT